MYEKILASYGHILGYMASVAPVASFRGHIIGQLNRSVCKYNAMPKVWQRDVAVGHRVLYSRTL